jgi:hypothetical protein
MPDFIRHDTLTAVNQILSRAWIYIAAVGLMLSVWILIPSRRDDGKPADDPATAKSMLWLFGMPFVAMAAVCIGVMAAGIASIAIDKQDSVILASRNFYGVLRVEHNDQAWAESERHVLMHGRIMHGLQLLNESRRNQPSSYYSEQSGIGLSIRGLRVLAAEGKRPPGLHLGVIGLGTGTMASWAQNGDRVLFYEINPEVEWISNEKFSYRRDCRGKAEVAMGDARITMEREQAQGTSRQFDVLVVDAFSGDAVPLHLLTRQAFAAYFHHLKPDGVLAVHVSNRYLELEPLVKGLAEDAGKLHAVIENSDDDEAFIDASTWVLVTSNKPLLELGLIQPHISQPDPANTRPHLLFTDDYSNLFQLLMED